MFWNLAVVRGVYGVFATIGGTYCRWFDDDLRTHMTLSRTEISNLLGIMHLGFFIYECTTQTYFDMKFKTFNRALHFHHLISLLASLYIVVGQVNHFYGATMPFLEMSTPFSCVCYCLLQLKMAESSLWKTNQLILIHIFHMRTVYEALNIYEMYIYWDAFKLIPIGMLIVHCMGLYSSNILKFKPSIIQLSYCLFFLFSFLLFNTNVDL
jgi:ceroid-lipofuscinosis neuronal protein 8